MDSQETPKPINSNNLSNKIEGSNNKVNNIIQYALNKNPKNAKRNKKKKLKRKIRKLINYIRHLHDHNRNIQAAYTQLQEAFKKLTLKK